MIGTYLHKSQDVKVRPVEALVRVERRRRRKTAERLSKVLNQHRKVDLKRVKYLEGFRIRLVEEAELTVDFLALEERPVGLKGRLSGGTPT